MSPDAPARYLHVANGTSVTMTLEAAGVPGLRSIWADPLHEGPVPYGSDDELLEVRRRYLATIHAAAESPGDDPARDPVNDMHQWRERIACHDQYEELVLWFEHDLFDQLNLIQLLTWIREHLPASKPVSLICIDAFPGRPEFKGLGELETGELAPLLETRQRVTDSQYHVSRTAWDAFRQPTPEALESFRQGDTAALPYLAPALTRFLQEYPWTGDGLSRTERRLLELAATPAALWSVFPRMGGGDRFYTITDLSLLATATTLAAASPPLLTLVASENSTRPFRAVVSLADAGRSVLEGRLDRVAACGIDRWLGGVHLQGRRSAWRWDEARRRLIGSTRPT